MCFILLYLAQYHITVDRLIVSSTPIEQSTSKQKTFTIRQSIIVYADLCYNKIRALVKTIGFVD